MLARKAPGIAAEVEDDRPARRRGRVPASDLRAVGTVDRHQLRGLEVRFGEIQHPAFGLVLKIALEQEHDRERRQIGDSDRNGDDNDDAAQSVHATILPPRRLGR